MGLALGRASRLGLCGKGEVGSLIELELGPEGASESHKQGEALTKGPREGGWAEHVGNGCWSSEG